MADPKEENKTPTVEELQAQLAKAQADLAKANDEKEKLKTANGKAASEAAEYKRQLREKQTEDEKKAADAREAKEKADAEAAERAAAEKARTDALEAQIKQLTLDKHTNAYIAMGYSEENAKAKAQALLEGDLEKEQALERAHLEAAIKAAKADAVGNMTKPPAGGSSGQPQKPMTYAETVAWMAAHPGETPK